MDEVKALELYDFFNEEGYDLGDFDNFKTALSTDNKRQELYSFFNEEGYDVGSYEEFTLKKKENSDSTSALEVGDLDTSQQNQDGFSEQQTSEVSQNNGIDLSKYRIPTEEDDLEVIQKGDVKLSESKSEEFEYDDVDLSKEESLNLTDEQSADIMIEASNPELFERKRELEEIISNQPTILTNEYTKELDEINSQIDNIRNFKPKSFRAVRENDLSEIESKRFEIESRANELSKETGIPVEKILEGNGTYNLIVEDWQKTKADIDRENEILKKATNDVTITEQFGSWLSYSPLFGNLYKPEPEQLELSKEIEEEILLSLEGTKLKKQLAFGGEDRTITSLSKREQLVQSAKQKVFVRESKKVVDEFNQNNERLSKLDPLKNKEEVDILKQRQEELKDKRDLLVFESGYDKVEGVFKDAFKKTTESREYDESLSDNKALDVLSSFAEGIVNVALDGTVGFAGAIVSAPDALTDDNSYSIFDAVGDTAYELSNNNILPSSQSSEGNLVDDSGNWNVSAYSVSKTAAEGLPFTLALINDARKGNVRNIYKKGARLFRPNNVKKAQGLSQAFQMAESAYKFTLSDNLQQAKELGLDGYKAQVLSHGMSVGTGLSQLVMPDVNFFKTPAGKNILTSFVGDLKGEVSKKAIKGAMTTFLTNLGKEVGEEELDAAISEVLKLGIAQNYSSEFLTAKQQKEIIGQTLIVSGLLGAAGLKSNINATKAELYKNVPKQYEGLIAQINSMIESSNDDNFKSMMSEAKNNIEDINNAISVTPENVTSEQIDLIIEKQKIVEEMTSVDESFQDAYKDKINTINEKIKSISAENEVKNETEEKFDNAESNNEININEETSVTIEEDLDDDSPMIVKESKSPDFIPAPSPKVLKARAESKAKLKSLRDRKNKRAKDIENIKREAVKYVKSILGTNDLNVIKKSEFNTIVQKIRDAKNPKDINRLVDALNEQVNKTEKRNADTKIKKLLGRKLKDSSGKGLISSEASDVITTIKNLKLLDKTVDDIAEIANASPDNDAIQEATDIARLIVSSNSDSISPRIAAEFATEASNKLSKVIDEGRLEIKELREADKERKKSNVQEARVDSSRKSRADVELNDSINKAMKSEIVDDVINAIEEVKKALGVEESLDLSSNDIKSLKETLNSLKEEYYKSSDFSSKIKSKNVFLDKVHQTYRQISSDLDTLVDIVSKKLSNEFLGGYLHSKISDGVRRSEEAYMTMTRANKTKIHDKMSELYGKSYSSIVIKLGDLVESVIADTSQKMKTGVFDSEGNEIELSRGNVMWLRNQYKNPKLKDNFENAGLTEEVMGKLSDEFLTKEDVEFSDWLSENFFEDMYSQVNDTFKKIYFRNLPKIDNYSGQVRYQGVDGVKSTDMLKDSGYSQEGATMFFGSGIDRVNNSRAIDTSQDVFSNLFNYVDSANRFSSSAEIYRDIKEILNDDQVTKNINNYNRGDIKSQIEKLVDLSFGFKDKKDGNVIINFLIGAKILSSLALTPKILLSQTISTSLWLTENTGGVINNSFKLMFNPIEGVKLIREIYNNSEYIRDRYNTANFKKVEAAYVAQNTSIGQKYRFVRLTRKTKDILFGKLALANVMIGDGLGMFMLGTPYYKTVKEEGLEKFNGDESKAIKFAIDKFNKRASKNQQSYKSNDRDIMQHTNLGKIVNMYGNSPKQYHRSTFQAALQIKRALQGREIKGTVAGNVWKLVLNHSIQGALYQWIGTALVGLLSEDDEDETKIKDIIWGATFGSLSKLFILGDLAQALWDTTQGKPYGENPQISPITTDYSKLFREIGNYKEAVEKGDDVKAEEVSADIYKVLLDLSGVPATKSENLINNYKTVLDGDYDSDEEMILRLLNYSQYQIDNMDKIHSEAREKEKKQKATETRKRRVKKQNRKKTKQFSKLY